MPRHRGHCRANLLVWLWYQVPRYVYMWCFQDQRRRPLVLFAWYLTYYPADFRQAEYYMDSSGQYLFNALIHTAEILTVTPAVAALQRAPQRGKTWKKNERYSHPRREGQNTGTSTVIRFFFIKNWKTSASCVIHQTRSLGVLILYVVFYL